MEQLIKKPNNQKGNPLLHYISVVFIVLAYILIKIGQIPLVFLSILGESLYKGPKKLSALLKNFHPSIPTFTFNLPKFTLPKVKPSFSLSINPPKRGRGRPKKIEVVKIKKRAVGRPRTQPLIPFYLSKLSRVFNKILPRSTRRKIVFAAIFILFVTYSIYLFRLASSLPSPEHLTTNPSPLTTQIYDRNGQLLYQFYEGKNRTLINLDEVPSDLINATIAIEDKNFYKHPGFDILGILRAVEVNYSTGTIQGGSTITQQLIKNTLLTPEQTFKRKLKEVVLAFWAERIYTKDEILKMYLSESPYGGPAWGVAAAAEMYFGKSVKDLTLAESAYLAGLPAAPTEYSPYGVHPEKGFARQREVLRRMVEDGYITPESATKALEEEITLRPPTQDIKAPHFVMHVRSLLASKYGEKVVSQGGLKVVTTLDLNLQTMAENVVSEQVSKLANLRVGNGAAMITDAKNGHILAMVGSKDYFNDSSGNFNVALALRQPGSSVKPITYAAAFEDGFSPGTILLDTQTTFRTGSEAYTPVNYDGRFHGATTVRTALGSSYNIPAVKMVSIIGVPRFIETATKMGITTLKSPDQYGLSITLGGGATKLIDMMSVYGTLASGGIKYQPEAILTVTDSHGMVLEDRRKPVGKRALAEEVAYLVNHILSDRQARAPAFGTNSLLEIPAKTVAVKTGTSDDKRDNWAFGYTPEYVVGAWVGNNDNSPMDPRLTSGITGATPIWHDIMANLIKDRPNLVFNRPLGITEGMVDGRKDLVIAGKQGKSAISARRTKQKDEATGTEKEVTSFSDQFNSIVAPQPTKAP